MKMLRIHLEGKTYEVGVEVLDDMTAGVPAVSHITSPISSPVTPAAVMAPATVSSPAVPTPATAEGCQAITSPMAGQVIKLLVKAGDQVTANQVVVMLDAMKMETPVHTPVSGKVQTVLVKEGDAVEEGQVLVQIQPA